MNVIHVERTIQDVSRKKASLNFMRSKMTEKFLTGYVLFILTLFQNFINIKNITKRNRVRAFLIG